MQLLITGGDCAYARAAIQQLHKSFTLRVVDTHFATHTSIPIPEGVEQLTGDLRNENFVNSITQNVETILHFAPLSLTLESEQANLEQITLGGYYLGHAAQKSQVNRILLASTMNLFATAPQSWAITPLWRPRPQPNVVDLCAYLAECGLRELARDRGVPVVCMRLGHADESVGATVLQALAARCDGWRVLHTLNHSPLPAAAPLSQIASRPIKKVVIFGAGGPMGAVTSQELAGHYQVRQSDVQSLDALIAAGPRKDQHPAAPRTLKLDPPHDERVVDIGKLDQVMAACEGMDAIINLTVIRHHVVNSFLVNTIGAYNVMAAAVAHGIRRVVHTGPFQLGISGAGGYNWDTLVEDGIPARPGHGMNTYFHTKFLGEEIVRSFAENHGLEVPALYFCDFVDFVNLRQADSYVHPFTTTWTDTARALRCAVEVPTLPSPFDLLHVNSDMPQNVFPNAKSKRVLGWQPQDALESWWVKK